MKNTILTIALIVLVCAAGYPIIRKHIVVSAPGSLRISSDVIAFVTAGQDMLAGNDIYYSPDGGKNSYVYPPFFAFVMIPLSFLHPLITDILWYALNILLIYLL